MQWSKIKNIVILLLLLANVLLLAHVVVREMESQRYHRQAREEAAALLAQNGIRVDLGELPDDPQLFPMRCERDIQREKDLAASLLGQASEQEDGSYAGTCGTMWFYSSGDFLAHLEPTAFPVGEKSETDVAAEVMERLDFQGQLRSVTEEDGRVLVELYQLWEQVPVFSCQVTLTFDGGQLTQIQGRRMPGDPVSQGGTGAMTVTTALVRFLSAAAEGGYVCSEIREMTAGYSMTAVPTSSTFRLSPIWQIETDAVNFRLDADGTLTQITE